MQRPQVPFPTRAIGTYPRAKRDRSSNLALPLCCSFPCWTQCSWVGKGQEWARVPPAGLTFLPCPRSSFLCLPHPPGLRFGMGKLGTLCPSSTSHPEVPKASARQWSEATRNPGSICVRVRSPGRPVGGVGLDAAHWQGQPSKAHLGLLPKGLLQDHPQGLPFPGLYAHQEIQERLGAAVNAGQEGGQWE